MNTAPADESAASDLAGPDTSLAEAGAAVPPARSWPGGVAVSRRGVAVAAMVVVAGISGLWLARERIADNLIAGQLRDLGLAGRYRIEEIGPRRQVLRDVVIGAPGQPDLTIARVVVEIAPRLGLPAVERITLVRPRLFGRWNGNRLSFGSLDKVINRQAGGEPFRLPDVALAVVDGRARLVGDHGTTGLAFEGAGPLRNGFSGTLAAIAPNLPLGGCRAGQASLFARVTTADEQPRLVGPLRAASVACGDGSGLRIARAGLQVDARIDRSLAGGEARLGLLTGQAAAAGMAAGGLSGTIDGTWRDAALTARYDLRGTGLAASRIGAGSLALSGLVRARDGFARIEADGHAVARQVQPGPALLAQLAGLERSTRDTLIAPLLGQVRQALLRESRNSRLEADFIARRSDGRGFSVVVPQGRLTGSSGATVLALSRFQYVTGIAAPRIAGNFTTGGADIPQIAGRLEQPGGGITRVHMTMADYRAGTARLAIPDMTVTQRSSGVLSFVGLAHASGPLPGGGAENLRLPLDGELDALGQLTLWRGCQTIGFDHLSYAGLVLERHDLPLCSGPGGAMVRIDQTGARLALGAPSLQLTGRLGDTPVRIASGPVGFAMPGVLYATGLDVALGPEATASRFRLADLRAQIGHDISGTFAGTDVRLAAVPLDLMDAAGNWSFADGQLSVHGARFRLEDRAQVDRFQPLEATMGELALRDNDITASALLNEPKSRHEVLRVVLRHDLARGRGRADLAVGGIVFDDALQPGMLSRDLLGVVANARGTVRGNGRIDWIPAGVTSSGRFGTDSLDFAAALGPVRGVSGMVEFTDLIGLVTAPHQRLSIAAINPGIEVGGGQMLFQLKPGAVAAVEGGTWPFLGGQLRLRPVDMRFGVAETRRYVLDIEGVDAARFLAQMELANISATGLFDGTLPLVFDENGGRVEQGVLTARPPGGNLSYVGALTYKDLSPIANFAFDALKSLDYRAMRIDLDGALEGEIVTRVRFDGVKQGAGARRNFLTRRVASLPLQFNVNLRAPFYQLITSFKAMYDPAYIQDPRNLGLIDARGQAVARPRAGSARPAPAPGRPAIQPPVSEKAP